MKIRVLLPLCSLVLSFTWSSSAVAVENAAPAAAFTDTHEADPQAEGPPEALERAEFDELEGGDEPAGGSTVLQASAVADDDRWDEDDEEAIDEGWDEEILPVRVGIGVSLSSRSFTLLGDDATVGAPVSFTNIQVPMHLGTSFRLEPEVGFYHQQGGVGSGLAGLLGSVAGSRTTSVRFLLGAQYAFPLSERTIAYLGPKVGLQSRSMEFRVDLEDLPIRQGEIRAIDYWVGGSVGGEAFLTEHFSLGVEVDFFYVNLGKTTATGGGVSLQDDRSNRSWILSTHGLLAARLYFL